MPLYTFSHLVKNLKTLNFGKYLHSNTSIYTLIRLSRLSTVLRFVFKVGMTKTSMNYAIILQCTFLSSTPVDQKTIDPSFVTYDW